MKHRATYIVGLRGMAVAAACSFFALPAYAQDDAAGPTETTTDVASPSSITPDVGAEEPEKITVTGSRISRSNLSSYAPIRVVTSEQLVNSGITTLDEFLFRLPSVSQQGITRFNNNGGDGVAQVDLRNLGVRRTLVLVNGRRYVGPSGIVDFNTIPVSMVDRVEVLLDGASAIYGSDAISGVINIILKEDFEGVQTDVFGGISGQGDGEQFQAAVTVGDTTERGSFVVSAQYLNRQEIEQVDRDWAEFPIVGFAGNDFDNDAIIGSSGVPETRLQYRGPDELTNFGDQVFRQNPATGESFQPFGADTRYNFGEEQWLTGRLETFNTSAVGSYEIDPAIEVFVEGMFNHRTSRQRLAPQPLFTLLTDTSNPLIPADYLDALSAAGANIDPTTGLDPDGNPQSLGINRRMTDIGNRFFAQEVSTFRMLAGIRGEVEGWNYDFYLGGGQNNEISQIRNSVNQIRAAELADPSLFGANGRVDEDVDPTPCSGRGCAGLADYFGRDTLSQESIDYMRFTQRNVNNYKQFILGGSVAGTITELPAGPLGLALGFIYRDERQRSLVDSETANGEDAGNFAQDTIGGFDTFEAFAETSIPLVAGIPGVHDLTVDLAGRFSDFSSFGSEFTYKVGATWAPIDWARLRGTFSTAFRAPSVAELFAGATESFESVQDPCDGLGSGDLDPTVAANCRADGVPDGFDQAETGTNQVSANVGGNPELDSETSTFLSGGVILTPPFFEQQGVAITITSDIYDYSVEDAIISPTEQSILDRCYSQSDEGACANIQRDPVTGGITALNASAVNAGDITARGIEFTTDINLDLETIAGLTETSLDIGYQLNYILEFTVDETVAGGNIDEFEGTFTSGSATYARTRWTTFVTLNYENLRFANILRFIGGADIFGIDENDDGIADFAEGFPPEAQSVDSIFYWDASASYSFGDTGLITTVGVDNVLDEDPPYSLESGQNANPNTYDFVGRYFYMRATYKY